MTDAFLIVVALASLVTLALKCAFIEGQQYFKLPPWFTDSLEFVPPAVLCALVIPGIFQGDVGLVNAFGPVAIDPEANCCERCRNHLCHHKKNHSHINRRNGLVVCRLLVTN